MKKILLALLILIIIILILLWLCRTGRLPFCKKEPPSWRTYISKDTNYQHIPADSTEQIVIWRNPEHTDPIFLNFWLDSISKYCPDLKIQVFCGHCDSSLMLLTGTHVRTAVAGTGGGKGGGSACSTTKCPPTGGGDTIYWSVNYPISFDTTQIEDTVFENKDYKTPRHLPPSVPTDTSIVVAVFDTGIDPSDITHQYKNNLPLCFDPGANNGWNFPAMNNVVKDDYHLPVGHGQIVQKIITEQVDHYPLNKVSILPVKIHNSNGQSDLFSVLCGFAYAADRGAKIINASFGFYALKQLPGSAGSLPDPDALLMKQYIKHYLTNNSILLIAAAGNKDITRNDVDERALFTSAGLPVPVDADIRNLDTVNFYPASFANDPELPNVIAVTTVSLTDKLVSKNQNYSENVVDIGVNGDVMFSDDYWFFNPRNNNHIIRGSSYATPIVTGILCSHYDMIKTNVPDLNKTGILTYLLKPGMNLGFTTTLNGKVKTGVFLKH